MSRHMQGYYRKDNKIANVHQWIISVNHRKEIERICPKDIHIFFQKKIKNAFDVIFG